MTTVATSNVEAPVSRAKPMFNIAHHKNLNAEINPQLCRLISHQLIMTTEEGDDPSVYAFAMRLQKHADFHGVDKIEDEEYVQEG